jgi:hypothetical protein
MLNFLKKSVGNGALQEESDSWSLFFPVQQVDQRRIRDEEPVPNLPEKGRHVDSFLSPSTNHHVENNTSVIRA